MRTNSLLGNFEDIEASMDPIKDIEQFIRDNYKVFDRLYISDEPNENGKYEVSCRSVEVVNKNITSLTNGLFEWKIIGLHFNCSECCSLTTLEGAPEEVRGCFYCYGCASLTSLKGAPEWINGDFSCAFCTALANLKGAPKKVGGNFNCSWCASLVSLEGAPEEVGRDFYCMDCVCLTSADGITEKIGGNCMFIGCRSIKITKNTPINIIEKIAR